MKVDSRNIAIYIGSDMKQDYQISVIWQPI